MSSGNLGDTCKFGHYIEAHKGIDKSLKKDIKKGRISSLKQLENSDDYGGFDELIGSPYKHVKVRDGSQGRPRAAAFTAADEWDNMDYTVSKSVEKIHVAPQSNLHAEYMQRKNQAEQNVRETMRNISQLMKTKHMLEHDIRKLRARAENLRTGNETEIKGDFIELVDGAGAGGQQGGDEASLKFYRDQNIYPSIVADFNEMDSLDDLKPEEEGGTGKLADLPRNEKAILRKKYSMYEKWKDMYGSEIQRKLKELKGQLNSIETSIEETKEWLEPYVKDAIQINEKSREDLKDELSRYPTLQGTSSQFRQLEFIVRRPLVNTGEVVETTDDKSEATHYQVVVVKAKHVNLAGFEQPQSPAQGPSAAVIMWHPVIVCKHVYENFFQARINRKANRFEQLMEDYTGELSDSGEPIRQALEKEDMRVRELREKVNQKLEEQDEDQVPLEFSAAIRRVQDGFEEPSHIAIEFGDPALEAVEEILDIDLQGNGENDKEMYTGFEKELRKFTGLVDRSVLPPDADPMGELKGIAKHEFYYDWKLSFGMYTMK